MKKNIVIATLIIIVMIGALIGLYQFDKLKAEYKADLETLKCELQLEKDARQTEKEAYQDTLKELKKKQKKAISEVVKTVKTYQDPISADVTKNGVKVNYENGTGYYLEGDQINRHEK